MGNDSRPARNGPILGRDDCPASCGYQSILLNPAMSALHVVPVKGRSQCGADSLPTLMVLAVLETRCLLIHFSFPLGTLMELDCIFSAPHHGVCARDQFPQMQCKLK